MNRLVLNAHIVERSSVRYTPAGLPAVDLSLKHESQVSQDGQARKVFFEIKARAVGSITTQVQGLALGSDHGFAGFLGSQRNGKGIVFHITEVHITAPA